MIWETGKGVVVGGGLVGGGEAGGLGRSRTGDYFTFATLHFRDCEYKSPVRYVGGICHRVQPTMS